MVCRQVCCAKVFLLCCLSPFYFLQILWCLIEQTKQKYGEFGEFWDFIHCIDTHLIRHNSYDMPNSQLMSILFYSISMCQCVIEWLIITTDENIIDYMLTVSNLYLPPYICLLCNNMILCCISLLCLTGRRLASNYHTLCTYSFLCPYKWHQVLLSYYHINYDNIIILSYHIIIYSHVGLDHMPFYTCPQHSFCDTTPPS